MGLFFKNGDSKPASKTRPRRATMMFDGYLLVHFETTPFACPATEGVSGCHLFRFHGLQMENLVFVSGDTKIAQFNAYFDSESDGRGHSNLGFWQHWLQGQVLDPAE